MTGGGERMPPWAWKAALVLAIGLLLGRLGPFGTFSELSAMERYGYWIGLTLLMWLQSVAVLALIDQPLSRKAWPRPARVILAGLMAAIPTAFEVAWAEMLLRVERDLGPLDILAIAGDVALLSVPTLLLTHGFRAPPRAAFAPEAVTSGARSLVARMEPRRRGDLLAVNSEDHYVRLYSDQGDELIAMRFGEALGMLAAGDGLQVHRRWWVAADAVESVARSGDGLELTLRNGMTVPVSRSYAQQVRKAWADRIP